MEIDITKCTGCGTCTSACPKQAITVRNNLAMIDRELCVECGKCAEVCPSGAIVDPARGEPAKGSDRVFYGYGRRPGGFSLSRPHIGRVRRGLPRYGQRGLYKGAASRPVSRTVPYTPVREDKLGVIKNQTEKMKRDMVEIKRRIQALEKGK